MDLNKPTMNKASILLMGLVLCLTFLSCGKDEFWTEGAYYHLEHKEAILPIWVKGDIDSGVFLFTIHGGPTAASGHEFALSPGFKELEKDVAVVYWDQRESGIAQGKPQDDGHTLQQYTEDARLVLQFIQEKYAPKDIFLLGIRPTKYMFSDNFLSYSFA